MNISKATGKYVDEHPRIKDCLSKGLLNYSALARKIVGELGLDKKTDFDAVLVALRRNYEKIKHTVVSDKKVLSLLRKSRLETRNKIGLVVLDRRASLIKLNSLMQKILEREEVFHLIQGSSSFTVYLSQNFLPDVEKLFGSEIIFKEKNFVQLNLKTPREIQNIPDTMGFVFFLLGENSINVFDAISSWTDNIFIIAERDAARAMELLKF